MIEETFSAPKTLPTSSYSAQQSDKFVVNLQEYEIKLTSNWQPKFIVAQFDGQAKALLIRTHPLPGDPVPIPFQPSLAVQTFQRRLGKGQFDGWSDKVGGGGNSSRN